MSESRMLRLFIPARTTEDSMCNTSLALSVAASLCALTQSALADETGTVTGAVGGAAAGAMVGGPVGAIVGGPVRRLPARIAQPSPRQQRGDDPPMERR